MTSGRVAVGHPVDIGSGAVFTAAHDFYLPGAIPLLWRRYYATDSAASTVLGPRWTTPFLMTLEADEQGWRLIDENGVAIRFPRPAQPLRTGERLINLPANMELWRLSDGYTIVHWHHGSSDLEIWRFRDAPRVLPLVAIENAAGNRLLIDHDGQGRPVRILQEIEQRPIGLHYDDRGRLASVALLRPQADPIVLARYTYDAAGLLAEASDAQGAVAQYRYDGEGRLATERNPLGSAFHFRYDPQGRCVLASGERRQMYRRLSYLAGGRIVAVTDSLGHVTRYVLNPAGQVLQRVSPSGATTSTQYDAMGRIVREINADGTSCAYDFDAEGNRAGMTFEDGSQVRMRYNDRHALISYTDAVGATWQLERDERNLLVGVVNPLGNRFAYTHDPQGFLIEQRSPSGRFTGYAYGPRYAWWEARDGIGFLARHEIDVFGNVVAQYDAAGLEYRLRYDLCHRPVEARHALGHTWTWSYNAIGEVVGYTDPSGLVERMQYDAFGQLVAHHTPLGEMRLDYDTEGRLTGVTNRNGERYSREYDPDGRIVREVFFDGREQRYRWSALNRIDEVRLGDGTPVSYSYGPSGEVTAIGCPRGLANAYEYDPRGYLVAACAPGSRIEIEIDRAGRLVAETQNGHRIETDYDRDNFPIARRVLGREIGFSYDARGRLAAISDAGGTFQRLSWNPLDQLEKRTTPEGLEERRSWERDDRLSGQTVTAWGIGRIERRYRYDAAGFVATIDDTARGRLHYGYDAIGRLTSVESERGERELYRYDAIGAIAETHRGARVVAPGGRTLKDDVADYSYDAAGMLVSATAADASVKRFEYDGRGQLRRAQLPDGTVVDYIYDALGRRCKRTSGESSTEYLYTGCLIAGERSAENGERIFAGSEWHTLAEWQDGQRRFVVADLSNVVREVLDSRGSLLWSGTFEAYGRPLREDGQAADRARFPGQFSDRASGLVDNFYRTFDPALACYLSPDPVGLAGGPNHYGYPRNPLFWFDIFALKCSVAHTTEENMDAHFDKTPPPGYVPISATGKNTNAPGIDRVYKARPGAGPPEYIIAEAKSGQAGRLGQTKHSGQQMSDTWINTGIGGPGESRLVKAVGPVEAAKIKNSAATSGNVTKTVFHQPGGSGAPTVTTKPYDPIGTGTTF